MHLKTSFAAITVALLLPGCSLMPDVSWSPKSEAHAVAYNQNSVQSLALGRHYQAQGRFELARETFLHGLATARDQEMKETLAAELEATDRLILSNR